MSKDKKKVSKQRNDERKTLMKVYKLDNWLPIHIQQLSYLRNLILLLAIGALGFTVSSFNNDDDTFRLLFIIVAVLFLVVICLGFIIAYLESENYRIKYRISRLLIKNSDYNHRVDEEKCTKNENSNRCLIKIQIVIFLLAIIFETILFILL